MSFRHLFTASLSGFLTSPTATHPQLYALNWILEVDGQKTPDLETFVQVIRSLPGDRFARVKLCHLDSKPKVITIKPDLLYWPTSELVLDRATRTWSKRMLQAAGGD